MVLDGIHSILAEALKSLNDDAPRMVLAKLQSQLPEWHCQLIQVQCEIAKALADDPFRRGWQAVDHLERRLLGNLSVLERGFLQLRPNLALSLRRGFLEVVTADLPTLLDHGDECLSFALFPFVNRLHLTGDTARISDLFIFPLLQRIDHLWFAEALCDDNSSKMVAAALSLGHLKSLSFRFWGECDDKTVLASHGGVISPDGAEALASSSGLSELQSLDLTFHDLGSSGTKHLADSRRFENLQTLFLDLNDIGDDGMRALASADGLRSLNSLSVRDNGISLEGLQEFLSGQRAKGLRCLCVTDNDFGPESGRAFAKASRLEALQHLYLANCSLGDEGFSCLLEFPRMSQLRSLNVDRNSIGDSFFGIFRVQQAIEHISAVSNVISDDVVDHLHGITGRESRVRSLNLRDNNLGDEFVRVISESPMFSSLETLHLAGNNVGDKGASFVRRSEFLKNLRLVSFDGSKVSTGEQRQLFERFGHGVSFT